MATPCPRCGTVNQPNARFCKSCGLTLASVTDPITTPPSAQSQSPQTPAPTAPMIRCPKCGTQNRNTARFCSSCRAPLAQPVVTPPAANPQAASPKAANPPPLVPPPAQPTGGNKTVVLPPTKPPAKGFRWLAIIPPIILLLLAFGLCGSVYGVYTMDSNRPTPTLVTILPTSTPEPTETSEPTETPRPPTETPTVPPSPTPRPPASATPTLPPDPPQPVVQMQIQPDGRFGFATNLGDPTNPLDDNKPLTYRLEGSTNPADGRTNSIRVWVDGQTPDFGGTAGTWVSRPGLSPDNAQLQSAWQYQDILFTEHVGAVVNPASNRIALFRIEFQAENLDSSPHDVGLRLMIDTLIGDFDGVPFLLPNQQGVTLSPLDLSGADVPDSFNVIEREDLSNPGVTVQFTLGGEDATRPDRLLLSSWCAADWQWDYFEQVGGKGVDFTQCQARGVTATKKDSAVGLFWNAGPLQAGETRTWVVYYGLGEYKKPAVKSDLVLDALKPLYNVGEEFYVTALIQNPSDGQSVRLEAPTEFELVEGTPEQAVPQAGLAFTQVSWRLRANAPINDAQIRVTLLPNGTVQTLTTTSQVLPTPTPTVTRTPRPTRTPTETSTPTITPTPCVTTVIQATCE